METAKEAIILAAMKGVRIHGLHGVRIRHISELAGVLPSSIYGYFRGKEDLMQACFERVDCQLAKMMQTAAEDASREKEAERRRRQFWNALFHWLADHDDETVFFHRYCDRPGTFLAEASGTSCCAAYTAAMEKLTGTEKGSFLSWLHEFLGTVRYAKYVIDGVLGHDMQTESDIYHMIFPG